MIRCPGRKNMAFRIDFIGSTPSPNPQAKYMTTNIQKRICSPIVLSFALTSLFYKQQLLLKILNQKGDFKSAYLSFGEVSLNEKSRYEKIQITLI